MSLSRNRVTPAHTPPEYAAWLERVQHGRRGVIVLVVALALPALLMTIGLLAVDVPWLYCCKSEAQNSADAAALAAAGMLREVDDPTVGALRLDHAIIAAEDLGRLNLVAHGVPTVTAQLSDRVLSPIMRRPLCADVRVTATVPLFFAPAIGRESAEVAAEASACASLNETPARVVLTR